MTVKEASNEASYPFCNTGLQRAPSIAVARLAAPALQLGNVLDSLRMAIGASISHADWLPLHRAKHKALPERRTTPLAVDVHLLSGSELRLSLDTGVTLAGLVDNVSWSHAGLAPEQQLLIISEERARNGGVAVYAKRLRRGWQETKRDVRSSLISCVNFFFLPEAFNRELYGRGLIGWAKASAWYQSLQAAQNRVAAESAAPQAPGSPGARMRIQIELLSGQVLLMEARCSLSFSSCFPDMLQAAMEAQIGEVRAAVERQIGVLVEQQRFLVLERRGPGPLTRISNTILLHSVAGLKTALGAAVWATSVVLAPLRPDDTFPLRVRSATGKLVTLQVRGETTVRELQRLLDGGSHVLCAPMQVPELTLPRAIPTLPACEAPPAVEVSPPVLSPVSGMPG